MEVGQARSNRRYWGFGLVLAGLLLCTGAFKLLRLAWVERHIDWVRQERLEHAAAQVQQELGQLEQQLLSQARWLATHPAVHAALRDAAQASEPICSEGLAQLFVRYRLPERGGIVLYDSTLRQVAWAGYSMPRGKVPALGQPSRQLYTELVEDPPWRTALSLWHPVVEKGTVVGAVRVLTLLVQRMPVENAYLASFDQVRLWSREYGLPFRLVVAERAPAVGAGEVVRPLQGFEGRTLGWLVIGLPAPNQVLRDEARRFNQLMAFWGTLLLLWGLWGLISWMRAAGNTPRRLLFRAGIVGLLWWGVRYAWIALDVPNRWQRGRTPLAPLFDPAHLASAFGGGLMRSIGDLLLTALFALGFALGALWVVQKQTGSFSKAAAWRFGGYIFTAIGMFGLVQLYGLVVHHSVLDSTLDYLTRTGLLPPRLVFLVCAALLLLLLALLLLLRVWGYALKSLFGNWSASKRVRWVLGVGVPLAVTGAAVAVLPVAWPMPPLVAFVLVAFGLSHTLWPLSLPPAGRWLTLRALLPVPFVLSVLLYPVLWGTLEGQRRLQVERALEQFGQGQDPRVVFAIEQALQELQADSLLGVWLAQAALLPRAERLDSLTAAVLRGSLLLSLESTYDVSVTFFDRGRRPVGRYEGLSMPGVTVSLEVDAAEFALLWERYQVQRGRLPFIESLSGRREPIQWQYAGLTAVRSVEGILVGWIMVRAEPQSPLYGAETPFPRVLVPSGFFGEVQAGLSLAEFRDGVLVRTQGRAFTRHQLDVQLVSRLAQQPALWQKETEEGRTYLTLYRRVAGGEASVIRAARIPALTLFDHLYYTLRLTLTGLVLVGIFYALGLAYRWRRGWLLLPEVRFQDRVLNALLAVGLIAVVVVGWVGVEVIEGESHRAVQAWLAQYLDRVERMLVMAAREGELPYQVLDRLSLDALAGQVGLDLQVYREGQLVATTRPRLVRERLLETHMPISAYVALYCTAQRSAFVTERLGTFTYWTGFRALLDAQGRPRYVVAVPALPEQERLEEERSRRIAYLFGALLLLVFLVLNAAWLAARALGRPLARLEEGLQAVARGELNRPLPIESRDELGALARTFNWMLEQLAENRRRLAQQERELAWREMARQVAHEIKNPLTPMKLSIQHLQRAFTQRRDPDRFAELFARVTTTLIEQIDTLARIADDFSTLARMPRRRPEPVDLNEVIREAVRLMEAEAGCAIELALHPEPLVVEADREELRRVYINLIKNALQALVPERPGHVRVTTRLELTDGQPVAYSTVEDNGRGIPKALRPRIFEPNFSTKTGGSGLGLAIVKQSIQDLQGSVGFETEEGKGTTFWLRLPLKLLEHDA